MAIMDRNIQVEGHHGLLANLPVDLVSKWDAICVEWENDGFPKSVKNPFHIEGKFLSEKEVEKELELEEEERQHQGGVVQHATSANKFVMLGLELEDCQQKVTLYKTSETFCYLLDVGESDGLTLDDPDCKPKEMKLWLSSNIPMESHVLVCLDGLPSMED
ncbi:uncharacterized protein ARMOST_11661 [Armillaria ostoyae]|uniref:Uncharacterized protein n=1 Tax=Armillaria ostoyae TaxID=47428 RepID=A0A284RHQ5_ARMOS|nr:uncharacterized protein ARMOST_11661 [Armillaria ostoyae]